jgi:hypothetical protein
MLSVVRDRLIPALLVLVGGVETVDADYVSGALLGVLAVVDCLVRRRRVKHGVEAVARAGALPPGTQPSADASLLAALERAGLPAKRVAEQVLLRSSDDRK